MLKKICSILTGILIAVLAILAAILILPKILGYETLAVLSGSMEPGMPVGSIVFVKEAAPEEIQVGDIITYRLSGNTLVTHRVAQIDAQTGDYITKGDANETEDSNPVSYNSVVGIANLHLPLLGYLSIYIKTPLGLAAACGMIIIIILLVFLPEILEKEEKKGEETETEKTDSV